MTLINQSNINDILDIRETALYLVEGNVRLGFPPSHIAIDLRANQILSANSAVLSFTRLTDHLWGVAVTEWNGYSRSEARKNHDRFPSLSEIIADRKGKKRPDGKARALNDFTAAAHGVYVPTSPPSSFVASYLKPAKPKPKAPQAMTTTSNNMTYENVTNKIMGIQNIINAHANTSTILDVYVGDRTTHDNEDVCGGGTIQVNGMPISIRFVGNNTIVWHDNKSHPIQFQNPESIASKIKKLITPTTYGWSVDNLSKQLFEQLTLLTIKFTNNNHITPVVTNSKPS